MGNDSNESGDEFAYKIAGAGILCGFYVLPAVIFEEVYKYFFHQKPTTAISYFFIIVSIAIVFYYYYKKYSFDDSIVDFIKQHLKKSIIFSVLFLILAFFINPKNSDFKSVIYVIFTVAGFFFGFNYSLLSPDIRNSKKFTQKGALLDDNNKQKASIKTINQSVKNKKICFANTIIQEESEPLHFAAIGSTGTGKSTAIKEILFTSKKRGDRHIICDPDGSYSNEFMKPTDVIINPFDERSVKWDYLSEIKEPFDYMLLASMVIPENQRDDEWRKYARQLLAASSEKWVEHKLGSSDEFFDFLITGQQLELATLCQGSVAARFFEDGNERMLGSILSTMSPFIEPLRHLKNVNGEPFSIRQWLHNGQGSLYIPYRANQISALQGLISAWLGLSIYETLSMSVDSSRRIWFMADEVDAIGRINGLKDALARLRKFGGRVVLGFQSISQLRLVYGDAEANTIIENCGNKLILRCDTSERGGTAEFASRLIGERDVSWVQVSESTTKKGETSYSHSVQEKRESAVMASEISQLPKLTGYLKIANYPVWQKTGFQHIDYSKLT